MNTYTRISRDAAYLRYVAGKPVYLIPYKIKPHDGSKLGELVTANGRDFETMRREFCAARCNSETGAYPKFYTVEPARETVPRFIAYRPVFADQLLRSRIVTEHGGGWITVEPCFFLDDDGKDVGFNQGGDTVLLHENDVALCLLPRVGC